MGMEKVKECCVWVPGKESPVKIVDVTCDDACMVNITNDCGITHPDGSGTLAGCKATVLPHFGVVMNKRVGTCHRFGYYTSGNVDEYENECGGIDKLSHTVTQKTCAKETKYTVESCECFDNKKTGATNKATNTKNKADIAKNHP